MELIELLTQFGLTNQEATIFLTLHSQGELTGYEVSKITGISRSNVYTALASLTEKGAAYLIEGENKIYAPVSAQEFCSNKIRHLKDAAQIIEANIPIRNEEDQGYYSISGRKNILDKMISIIADAKERIYLSMHKEVIGELNPAILEAIKRKLKVVIITNGNFNLPGAQVFRSDKELNEIRLIADSTKVITGDVKDQNSTGLYSQKKNLVKLLKESLTNEIELIKIRASANTGNF